VYLGEIQLTRDQIHLNPFKSSQTEQALGSKALVGYKKQPNLVRDSLATASKKLYLHHRPVSSRTVGVAGVERSRKPNL
jgi:hypothetical protein